MKLLLLIFACILLVGCQPSSAPDAQGGNFQLPTDLKIIVEHGPCYGTCPVYTVTLHPGGRVTFQGTGQGTGFAVGPVLPLVVAPEQLRRLVTAIEASNFFALPASNTLWMDAPTTTMTIKMNGQSKSIVYMGFRCGLLSNDVPLALCSLETLIDEVADTKHWVFGE